GRFLGKRPATL
ncbi:hypothetical protein KKC1_20200, partial [Calderihabitans maritimus]